MNMPAQIPQTPCYKHILGMYCMPRQVKAKLSTENQCLTKWHRCFHRQNLRGSGPALMVPVASGYFVGKLPSAISPP